DQLPQAVGALLHQAGALALGGDLVDLLPDPVELRVTDPVVVGARLVGIRRDALGAEVDALSRALARRDLRGECDLEVAVWQRLAEEDARALVVGRELEAGVLPLTLQDLFGELPPLVAGGDPDRQRRLLTALGPDAVAALRPAVAGHQAV